MTGRIGVENRFHRCFVPSAGSPLCAIGFAKAEHVMSVYADGLGYVGTRAEFVNATVG